LYCPGFNTSAVAFDHFSSVQVTSSPAATATRPSRAVALPAGAVVAAPAAPGQPVNVMVTVVVMG
jgi:hypothetical protein